MVGHINNFGKTPYRFGKRAPLTTRAERPILAKLRGHQTPVMTSQAAMSRVLWRRFTQSELSGTKLKDEIGIHPSTLYDIINGQTVNYTTGNIQSVCEYLGIRFNHLPYSGKILSDVNEILEEVQLRAETLQIDLDSTDFNNFAGLSFEELKSTLLEKGITPKIHTLLVDQFRIRLWPLFKQKKTVTENNLEDVMKDILKWMEKLRINYHDFGSSIGYKLETIQKFFNNPQLTGPLAKTIFNHFGYEPYVDSDYYTQEELPDYPEPQFFNTGLVEAIEHQRALIGWSYATLTRPLSVAHHNSIIQLYNTLRTPYQNRRHSTEGRIPCCLEICDILKIQLHTVDTIPEEELDPCSSLIEIGQILMKKQYELGLHSEDVVQMLWDRFQYKTSTTSLTRIHRGQISRRMKALCEALMKLFKIKIDPLEQSPKNIPQTDDWKPSHIKAELKAYYDGIMVSQQRFLDITGMPNQKFGAVIAGRTSLDHEETKQVFRLFNISIPGDEHFVRFQKLEDLRKLQNLSIYEICDDLNIDENDYYKLKAGVFSMDSNIAQEIKRYIKSHSWKNKIATKLNQDGIAKFANHIGFDVHVIQSAIKKDDPLFSDVMLELAIHYNEFDEAMAQHVLELYSDDPEILNDQNFPNSPFYVYNFNNISRINLNRNRLLLKSLNNQYLTQAETQFLEETGGNLEDIKNMSIWQICYRYSIGDTATACLAWTQKELSLDRFKATYRKWLMENYGINLNNQAPTTKIPGKPILVVSEITLFEAFVNIHQLYGSKKILAAR